MTTENMTIPERVATLEEAYRHLATKEDLAELKVLIANQDARITEDLAQLNTRITDSTAQLNTRITDSAAQLNASIAELKILIERSHSNSIKWTIGTILAIFAVAATIFGAVSALD